MSTAFVALGSNLGPRTAHFERALALLGADPEVTVAARSRWHETGPMGPAQPRFLNGVVRIETSLSPEALLGLLRAVERRCGRTPGRPRWSARVLDLDLVAYDDRRIRRARLEVPHGLERPFVRVPFEEVAC